MKASEKIREKNYSSFISFVSEFELLFLIPKIKDGLFKLKMQGRNVLNKLPGHLLEKTCEYELFNRLGNLSFTKRN